MSDYVPQPYVAQQYVPGGGLSSANDPPASPQQASSSPYQPASSPPSYTQPVAAASNKVEASCHSCEDSVASYKPQEAQAATTSASNAKTGCLPACLVTTLLFVLVIVLPLSFSYLEYYEYGLVMRTTTGSVNTERVYSQGRYALGPGKKFVKYQADAHFVELSAHTPFAELIISPSDFLKEDKIGQIHQELFSGYRKVIESRAKDAIKNDAASITFTEYFQERKSVELRFRDAIQQRWNEDPPVHCTLDQFHLGRIRIPDSVAEKQLQSKIQNERNEQEASIQKAKIEREQTGVQVNKVQLEKEKLLRTAHAEANLLRANAKVDASRTIQEAEIVGTQTLVQAAGITTQEQLTSFTYIRTLMHRAGLELSVSYLDADNVLRTSSVV